MTLSTLLGRARKIGKCTTPSDMGLSMKETALNFAWQIRV